MFSGIVYQCHPVCCDRWLLRLGSTNRVTSFPSREEAEEALWRAHRLWAAAWAGVVPEAA